LLIEEIKKTDLFVVMVTNEIGMSIVPGNRLSRIYTDIAGRINQYIAKESNEVYLVISGIPMKIKG
jgi:adenosylcobinamide kinase/adenosylcobinamide-phosphate guanylyltransferase